jgi:hypothetical protein
MMAVSARDTRYRLEKKASATRIAASPAPQHARRVQSKRGPLGAGASSAARRAAAGVETRGSVSRRAVVRPSMTVVSRGFGTEGFGGRPA